METKAPTRIRQIEILRTIRLHEPISGPQLAKMFDRTRQAMYLRLRMLEKKGLIERATISPEGPVVPVYYRCSQRLKDAERRLAGEETD
jgi:DNA-binding MarR family transcriptional regulator